MTGGLYPKLAKSVAEHYIRRHEVLEPAPTLSTELLQQKACYVSVFEKPGHNLRSMYGSPLPTQVSLALEIISNTVRAISLSSGHPIRRPDLSYLTYAVAILGPLERIAGPEHLDPERYGLLIRSDRDKSAVLLPQRTGVETAEDQIATVMRESGINLRQESATLYRFGVTYYE